VLIIAGPRDILACWVNKDEKANRSKSAYCFLVRDNVKWVDKRKRSERIRLSPHLE